MTDDDFDLFDESFRRLASHYRLKTRPTELADLSRTYFRLLEDHPIRAVLDAGKRWLAGNRKFPKAVDWLDTLAAGSGPNAPRDVRQMAVDELAAYADAEQRRYTADPCRCAACARAGVDDLPMRFVPTLITEDDYERAYNPQRHRMQIAGHWAHAEELRRWYDARDACYRLATNHPLAMRLVMAGREPGQEG